MSQLGFCYVNLHSGATEFISLLSDEVTNIIDASYEKNQDKCAIQYR